jgi:hypothetical protein
MKVLSGQPLPFPSENIGRHECRGSKGNLKPFRRSRDEDISGKMVVVDRKKGLGRKDDLQDAF